MHSAFTGLPFQCYPMFLYLFCISIFLPNIPNPHAPTLEQENQFKAGPGQMLL